MRQRTNGNLINRIHDIHVDNDISLCIFSNAFFFCPFSFSSSFIFSSSQVSQGPSQASLDLGHAPMGFNQASQSPNFQGTPLGLPGPQPGLQGLQPDQLGNHSGLPSPHPGLSGPHPGLSVPDRATDRSLRAQARPHNPSFQGLSQASKASSRISWGTIQDSWGPSQAPRSPGRPSAVSAMIPKSPITILLKRYLTACINYIIIGPANICSPLPSTQSEVQNKNNTYNLGSN